MSLRWVLEAAQVAQFADQGHGGDLLEAFAGHQGPDHRLPFPVGEDLLHAGGEALDAFVSRVDGLEILFEDEVLYGIPEG